LSRIARHDTQTPVLVITTRYARNAAVTMWPSIQRTIAIGAPVTTMPTIADRYTRPVLRWAGVPLRSSAAVQKVTRATAPTRTCTATSIW